jgi:hypothetical protein
MGVEEVKVEVAGKERAHATTRLDHLLCSFDTVILWLVITTTLGLISYYTVFLDRCQHMPEFTEEDVAEEQAAFAKVLATFHAYARFSVRISSIPMLYGCHSGRDDKCILRLTDIYKLSSLPTTAVARTSTTSLALINSSSPALGPEPDTPRS